jgi:protein SCO1
MSSIKRAALCVAALCTGAQIAVADLAQQGSASALNADAAIRASQAAIGRSLADYALVDANGRTVRLSSYRGRPLLINFVYSGCFEICPTATRNLKRAVEAAQGVLGADAFRVASIGFNLPFDTPDALRAFARQQGADLKGWDFLSPQPAELKALTRDLGFSYAPTPRGFDHVLQISVVDADGRIYRQIYGEAVSVPQVVGALKELITGARRESETLSGFIERVRILCTVYDPASGTYRVKYSIFFELGGGLVGLIAIAWFFVYELRRARS